MCVREQWNVNEGYKSNVKKEEEEKVEVAIGIEFEYDRRAMAKIQVSIIS